MAYHLLVVERATHILWLESRNNNADERLEDVGNWEEWKGLYDDVIWWEN